MRPRLLAALALGLAALAAGCRNRDENTPIAVISVPFNAGGRAVRIDYTIKNPDTIGASIFAFYSIDGGNSYSSATANPLSEPTTNLVATSGGSSHAFLWDALADLGPGRHDGLVFRIVPTENGHVGTIATSFGFVIDNTDIFVRAADLSLSRLGSASAVGPDGGPVVAGGASLSSSTEALTPTASAFAARANLDPARDGARATTLLALDGSEIEPRPVVVGGVTTTALGDVAALDSDDGPGAWLAGSPLQQPRAGHTVTRLADGVSALVAGGQDGSAFVPSDEIIDASGAIAIVSTGCGRTGHTATLLQDGSVLIAGGTTASGVTASTLIFSPTSTAYTAGPSLTSARTGHAAALVGGRVAVFGGASAGGVVLSTAEVLSTSLAAFSVTVDVNGAQTFMTHARRDFTASPLGPQGALLVGGRDGSVDLASAERFDVVSGAFTATRGPLAVARHGHDAVVHGTGRVLITGGGSAAAEVYLPASEEGTQAFDPEASSNPAPRAEAAAAPLLDGRVLITGGTDGVILPSGLPATLGSVDLYTVNPLPPTPRTIPIARLLTARRRHSATTLGDGRVLIAGGLDAGGAPIAGAELFDPAAFGSGGATFTAVAQPLPVPVSGHTATRLLDGRVLIVGGVDAGSAAQALAQLFTPGTATFATAPLAAARSHHTATIMPDGRVLIAGGISGGVATASVEVFDPSRNGGLGASVTVTGSLPGARFDHSAVLLDDGTVLILGGRATPGGAPLSDAAIFNPSANTVTPGGSFGEGRADFTGIFDGLGRVMIVGGVTGPAPLGNDLASPVTGGAIIYDPAGNGGLGLTSEAFGLGLSAPRRGMAAVVITNDGRTLLVGGRDASGAVVPGLERVSP